MIQMTRELIKNEVDAAEFFAIIADETTDVSVQNQLTTFLRYVFKGQLHERFLGFTNVSNVPGLEELQLRCMIIWFIWKQFLKL